MLPDVAGVRKVFDYAVPAGLAPRVAPGVRVRVPLHGRRVGGWVLEVGVEPPAGVALKPIAKVTGLGPPDDLLELGRWAAWRWAGPRRAFLGTASPPAAVGALPAVPATPPLVVPGGDLAAELAAEALRHPVAVVRLPPSADPYGAVLAAAAHGPALVVTPSVDAGRALAVRLRRAGLPVAGYPRDWALGAAGATVVGARAAAWAPVDGLAAVVVLDEHDEGLQEERAPTWHAREVAQERSRRAGVPCLLVSPCPSLEALGAGPLVAPSRAEERAGWPVVEVADRRREDPRRAGLYSPRLVEHLRGPGRVVCVLNRTGRARLLVCAACGEVARCEVCAAAVGDDEGRLVCRRCAAQRPLVCASCGGGVLRAVRLGTARVREEVEALAGAPVAEVTASTPPEPVLDARVLVGTEAVLHRVAAADVVAFLDLDQELLAPRVRAAELALALLARAARVVGGRAGGGRLLLQTRLPHHEVVEAAVRADPAIVAGVEAERRRSLAMPPVTAVAEVSGPAADAFVVAVREAGAGAVEVLGPLDGRWLVRAGSHRELSDALAAVPRPPGRLRVAVDPWRL